jgi:hypothetical protein
MDAVTEDLQKSRRPTKEHRAAFLQKKDGINPPDNSTE